MHQTINIPRSWNTRIPPSPCPHPSWDAHLVDSLVTGILQPQVNHRVLQRPPHVEFQREVINPLEEKTTPWSPFPGLVGAPLGSRSCYLKNKQGKKTQLSTEQGGLHQDFQGCGSWVSLQLSCSFPNREEAVLLDKPCCPVPGWGQLQDGHPIHTGGSTKLNFKEEPFPKVTPGCKATGKPSGLALAVGTWGFLCCPLAAGDTLPLTPRPLRPCVSRAPASAPAGFKEGFRLGEVADSTGFPRTCAGSGREWRWERILES